MEKMIYLVRHGETEWNLQKRYQGQLDSELTELGREQARETGVLLKNTSFDLHICSDLPRARKTADIIAEIIKKPIDHTYTAIRERHFGKLQGLRQSDEVVEQFPEMKGDIFASNPTLKIPDGESFYDFYNRVIPFFEKLVDSTPAKNILVVAHGGILNCVFRFVLGIPLEQKRNFSIKNASINTFKVDENGWHLSSWGVTHIV